MINPFQSTSEVKKMQLHLGGVKSRNGFTLVEILVVMAIMAILGTILVIIFTNTLRGSNKSQILANIKQNGQGVLESLDKTIRGADDIICTSQSGVTLVIVKNGCYTRYRFIAPSPSQNGQIQQDNPQPDPSTPCVQNSPLPSPRGIKPFTDAVCTDTDPMVSPNVLTDTNSQSGVSVACVASDCVKNPIFTRNKSSGFSDQVTVKFGLKPGIGAPAVVSGQIDPVAFQTSIGLR